MNKKESTSKNTKGLLKQIETFKDSYSEVTNQDIKDLLKDVFNADDIKGPITYWTGHGGAVDAIMWWAKATGRELTELEEIYVSAALGPGCYQIDAEFYKSTDEFLDEIKSKTVVLDEENKIVKLIDEKDN